MELVLAEHRRIRRLFAALDGAAGRARAPHPAAPGPVWARLAEILTRHSEAEQEICFLAMFHPYRRRREEMAAAVADLNDLREAVAEAALHRSGCPAWSAAVLAAQLATERHCAVIEQAGLTAEPFCDGQRRVDLGRQWVAFAAAQMRDASVRLSGHAGPGRSQPAWSRPGTGLPGGRVHPAPCCGRGDASRAMPARARGTAARRAPGVRR